MVCKHNIIIREDPPLTTPIWSCNDCEEEFDIENVEKLEKA